MASEHELDVLAWTMLGEAAGEGRDGMADVGHVVLNRLSTGRYGNSIEEVAKADRQFSTWNRGAGGNNPQGRYPKSSSAFKEARALAEKVVSGAIPGPPGRPLDYHTPDIKPYWADSKNRYGTYERNGHLYYASVPIPPGEIPQVATQTDTRRPPVKGSPTALPPMLAAQRSLQPLKPDTAALYQGIYPAAAPKAPISNQNLVFGRGITDTVERSQAGQNQSLAAALQRSIAASQRPPISTAAISYAGQERQPAPRVTTIASIPTRPQVSGAVTYAGQDRGSTPSRRPVPAMPVQTAQSYAGQERNPAQSRTVAALPPIPPSNSVVPRHFDVTLQRAAAAQDPVLTAALARSTAPTMTTAQARADNGQGRPAPRSPTKSGPMDPVTAMPSWGEFQTAFAAPAVPGPRLPAKLGEERLVAGLYPMAPTPMPAMPKLPGQDVGVGTQLSVVPNVALPRPRPNVATVSFPTPVTARPQTRQVAMPTPLAMRPTMPAAPIARSIFGMPTPVAQRPVAARPVAMPTPNALRPVTPGALNVVVQGAGTIQPSRSGSSGSSGSSPQYVSASTGERVYATQTKHYNPDTNTFEKVTTYTPKR